MDHGSAGFANGRWHGYAEPHGTGKPQQAPPAAPSPGPSLPWQSFAADGPQPYAANAAGAPHENGFGGQDAHRADGQQPQAIVGQWSAAEFTAVGQPPHDWQQPPAPAPDDGTADEPPPPLPPPDDDAPPPLPDELPPETPPAGSDFGGTQQQQQPAFLPHPSLQYAVPAEQVRSEDCIEMNLREVLLLDSCHFWMVTRAGVTCMSRAVEASQFCASAWLRMVPGVGAQC